MNSKIEFIKPSLLNFDCHNPRIAEFGVNDKTSDQDIIQILWDVMGVEEIVLSIKASGFFEHEPLIAVIENGKNIIIEGNRRLAAVRCILNPNIADELGINKNLLNVSEEVRQSLLQIPVIFVKERKDAWKFIGFKHINGPAKWGSYAKAQYISQIKNEYGVSLEDIASQLGDTNGTVKNIYQALQVIDQAERIGKFDRTDITANRLFFSHLYTGLTSDGFKDFLGINEINEDAKDPVPSDKAENLGDLLTWVFGSKSKEVAPVIRSQNPDLRNLGAVLKSPEAVLALKDGVPLSVAYDISRPKDQALEHSLEEAKRALQKAHSFQTLGYDGQTDKLLRSAGSVLKLAQELYSIMLKKFQETNAPKPDNEIKFTEETDV